MKIVAIREQTAPLQSTLRNAYIDFGKMTASIVAVVTDVIRDGRPVIGHGFNSNGRYAAGGILRDRVIPRILEADPTSLLNDEGTNFDPHRIWPIMMANEKPGGHGERSVAVGTVDMALWDAVAKIEGKPLYRLLAERYRGGDPDESVFIYAAGGYYQPDKGLEALQDEMRGYLDLGYTVVKMKIGGAPIEEDLRRIEAVWPSTSRPASASAATSPIRASSSPSAASPMGWPSKRAGSGCRTCRAWDSRQRRTCTRCFER